MTLTRDAIIDKSAATIPAADSSALQCVSDPSTILQSAKPVSTLADLPAPEAKPKDGATDNVAGKPSQPGTGQNKATSGNTQQSTTVVLQ
jgi:hypothetical protein